LTLTEKRSTAQTWLLSQYDDKVFLSRCSLRNKCQLTLTHHQVKIPAHFKRNLDSAADTDTVS